MIALTKCAPMGSQSNGVLKMDMVKVFINSVGVLAVIMGTLAIIDAALTRWVM